MYIYIYICIRQLAAQLRQRVVLERLLAHNNTIVSDSNMINNITINNDNSMNNNNIINI